ncbi:TPA: hypothetical protein NI610_005954 [Pseudomonas aeruginosa]|nr:hypothetical protein [Pseudomonas aeruginosa]
MSDVEIWLAQKEELSWFLRSNTEIECFLSYQNAARSETDFFNRIGQQRTPVSFTEQRQVIEIVREAQTEIQA